eukprot:SM000036S13282  [mRNA]  locus=s36:323756:325129:- [translate_table: standard]
MAYAGGYAQQAPVPVYGNPGMPPGPAGGPPHGRWTTGLCGCFEDLGICFCSCCVPCLILGRNAEIVDDGHTGLLWYVIQIFTGCGCFYSMGFRSKLRQKYNLPDNCAGDCCTHCLCACCAFAQENRELKNRGWDPAIGYQANIIKFQSQGTVPPQGQSMYK